MDTILLKHLPIEISKEAILKRIGFKAGKSILTPNIHNIIEDLFSAYNGLLDPKVIYKNFNIEVISHHPNPPALMGVGGNVEYLIKIKGSGVSFKSKALSTNLNFCKIISVFACTIGNVIEKETVEALGKGDNSRALVIDAIGSEAVEALAERCNRLISETARGKRFVTVKRFSPGYSDWNLKEQRLLFDLIKPEQIGIKLTEGDIMKPEKSITGVIGWKG